MNRKIIETSIFPSLEKILKNCNQKNLEKATTLLKQLKQGDISHGLKKYKIKK